MYVFACINLFKGRLVVAHRRIPASHFTSQLPNLDSRNAYYLEMISSPLRPHRLRTLQSKFFEGNDQLSRMLDITASLPMTDASSLSSGMFGGTKW
jgi:hypothetical protein